MQLLKDRIRKEGIVKQGNVLKVDRFLNHQLDLELFHEIGKELKIRFQGENITKILTIESSGIGIACIVAEEFGVPVVVAKKSKTKNISGEVFTKQVEPIGHGKPYEITVSKDFLNADDKVLIVDDILVNGKALERLADLAVDSGAELAGIAVAIEKGFQIGGKIIRDKGIRVEPMVIVDDLDWRTGKIVFRGDE